MKSRYLIFTLLLSFSSLTGAADEPVTKTLVWPDGTRYVGGVVEGKRHGKGTIFWQDGTRFVGEFRNDMRNGPGTMILPDGTVYNGYFQDDELTDSPPEVAARVPETGAPDVTAEAVAEASAAAATAAATESEPEPVSVASVTQPEPTPTPELAPTPVPEMPLDDSIRSLTPEVEQQLTKAIYSWSGAWSDQNVAGYLASYAADFDVPGRLDRKQWEALRRTRLTRPQFINIDIVFEKFEIIEPDVAEVFFKQTYQSNTYGDETNKVLKLRREDSSWRIISEGSR